MTPLFNLALALYVASLVSGVVYLLGRRRGFEIACNVLLAAGAAVQTVYIGWRWMAAGRPPFSNMFESLTLFAWTVAVICLALRAWKRIPWLGAASALLSALVLAHASTFESSIEPLMPALQSNWLTFHVFTCFLGYGGFAIAFLASVGYLILDRPNRPERKELLGQLDSTMTGTTSFGFLFLSLGIITGAVWANSAWGTYWSWDPKETWSLITWFVYAFYLHCRFMRGWRGNRAAWVSVIGFISVLFTYYGVNFLLAGLHSYAKGS